MNCADGSVQSIFMGWDSRESLAYRVAKYSIIRRATEDVNILPVSHGHELIVDRPIEMRGRQLWCPISQAPMATEFSIARFIVPFVHREMSGQLYSWTLFIDCDVLCRSNIIELFELADDRYAVMVVKHDQDPRETIKMDGMAQTRYARKNWSSVVLWNTAHPANDRLTLKDILERPGRDLHRFFWLRDEEIGELPGEWNYLVGVEQDSKFTNAKMIHYTLGTPNMPGYETCVGSGLWRDELARYEEASPIYERRIHHH